MGDKGGGAETPQTMTKSTLNNTKLIRRKFMVARRDSYLTPCIFRLEVGPSPGDVVFVIPIAQFSNGNSLQSWQPCVQS